MSHQTQYRIEMIEAFLADAITSVDASRRLGVHRVTFYRLVNRYRRFGRKGLEHGLRGRRSNHAKSEALRQTVLDLYRKRAASTGGSVHSFYHAVKSSLPQKISYGTVLSWTHAFLVNRSGEDLSPQPSENFSRYEQCSSMTELKIF